MNFFIYSKKMFEPDVASGFTMRVKGNEPMTTPAMPLLS